MQSAGGEAGGLHTEKGATNVSHLACGLTLRCVQEATWRRLQTKFAESSKGTVEGGGSHDVLDLSEVGRNEDDTREGYVDE